MISFITKTILPLLLVLATFFVAYNYFWGDEQEKQSSREIINQVKSLTGSVVKLLGSEKEKYEQGKYDDALGKIKASFMVIRDKARDMGDYGREILDRVDKLEQQEQELENQLSVLDQEGDPEGLADSYRQQILSINQQTEKLCDRFENP